MSSHGRSYQKVTNDGNDHMHRERVAVQYKQSTYHKKKIEKIFYVLAIMSLAGSTYGALVHHVVDKTKFVFPPWSMMWLVGLLPVGFGISSIKKNNVANMSIFIRGSILFTGGAIVWCCIDNFADLVHLIKKCLEKSSIFEKSNL